MSGYSHSARALEILPGGLINGSSPYATLSTIQHLAEEKAVDLDAGLARLLTPPQLSESADEAFRWYSGIHWNGISSPEQRAAFLAAFTRRNITATTASLYSQPENAELRAHRTWKRCSFSVPLSKGRALVDVSVRQEPFKPFSLPLTVRRGGSTFSTYNASLSIELSKLLPADSWLRGQLGPGEDWTMFEGATAGALLPKELQKPIMSPNDLLAPYRSIAGGWHLTFYALRFKGPFYIRWSLSLTAADPRTNATVRATLYDNVVTINRFDVADGQRALAALEANSAFMSHLQSSDDVRLYPIALTSETKSFGRELSLTSLRDESEEFGAASIWPSIEAATHHAQVVEVYDTKNSVLYYQVLLDDGRLLFWKYTSKPPAWLDPHLRTTGCGDDETCVNAFVEGPR